jgi:hypothetical protein
MPAVDGSGEQIRAGPHRGSKEGDYAFLILCWVFFGGILIFIFLEVFYQFLSKITIALELPLFVGFVCLVTSCHYGSRGASGRDSYIQGSGI